jgi:hypothetical protein
MLLSSTLALVLLAALYGPPAAAQKQPLLGWKNISNPGPGFKHFSAPILYFDTEEGRIGVCFPDVQLLHGQ